MATAALAASSCVAIANVDDIEFGPATAAGTATGTAAGGGGSTATCDDGVQNGQETGRDCGGPECNPCDEDCQNGVDDNGDELVDCADPICAGYQCVAAVPSGWSGPHAIYLEAGGDVIGCDPAWATSETALGGTLLAEEAQCIACSCSTPSGGTCGQPNLDFWADAGCNGQADLQRPMDEGPEQCHDLGAGSYTSVRASLISAHGGTCTPGGGGLASPLNANYSETGVLCSEPTTGGGCEPEAPLCVRRPPSPFAPTLCIGQAGEHPCPDGSYSEQRVLYGGFTDDRRCSDCSCSSATGQTCAGSIVVFTNDICSEGGVVDVPPGTDCLNQTGMRSAGYSLTTGTPSGGQCPATGGVLSGSVAPSAPRTLCCLPQ